MRCGLVGLVAGCLGGNVLLTDQEVLVPLLQQNVTLNKEVLTGKVGVRKLDWNEDVDVGNTYDYVLGTDVVFKKVKYKNNNPMKYENKKNIENNIL